MKAKYEEKFIVINTKRFDEMADAVAPLTGEFLSVRHHKAVQNLLDAMRDFEDAYKDTGKSYPDNKYYVVNQDEPYAQQVIDLILENEGQSHENN